jgi:hypothetical protein
VSSREQDHIVEIAANLKAMAAAMGQAAHTVAQKVVQDSLTRGTWWNRDCFVRRTPPDIEAECRQYLTRWQTRTGDLLEQRLLCPETPPDTEAECRQDPTRQQTRERLSCVSGRSRSRSQELRSEIKPMPSNSYLCRVLGQIT